MAYSVHIGQKLLNRQIVTYFHILFMVAAFFPPLLNFKELSHKSTIHFSWNNSNCGYQSIFMPFFNQKQVNIYLLLIEFKMMLNIIEISILFIYLAKIEFKISRLESALQEKKKELRVLVNLLTICTSRKQLSRIPQPFGLKQIKPIRVQCYDVRCYSLSQITYIYPRQFNINGPQQNKTKPAPRL